MLSRVRIAWWAEAGRKKDRLNITTAIQGDTSGFKVQNRAVIYYLSWPPALPG